VLTNAGTIVSIVSGILALVSVAGGIFTAVRSGKDRRERDSDRLRVEAEREKLGAEQDKIKSEAAEIALRSLRSELDAAYKDIDRRREIMKKQDERIDEQDVVIRAANRRIAALEDWADDVKNFLDDAGIKGAPRVPHEPRTEAQ
jgi:predicted  nucleic acid-binding Zn-ribbon protein